MSWPWSELGLPGPAGLPEIRRAYARRLKQAHPEEDPEGFQRLHAAYREAARRARANTQPVPEQPPEKAPDTPEPAPGEGGAWDYDELLKSRKSPEKAPGTPPEKAEEWDYDELLKGRKSPEKAPGTPPEKAEEWDYDELLKGRKSPKKAPEKTPEKTEEWNYDELLEEEEPPEPAPREPDWDFERLFAEGDAEADALRRRKLEELREKNRARYAKAEQEQRRRAAEEEESWRAVMAASHALELLYEAPLPLWRSFLNSSVFQDVRSNIDFVFVLEDFLEQHPDLPPNVRMSLFSAYEAYNGSKYPMYNRLYRLLNVSPRDKRRIARQKSAWRARWHGFPLWRKACGVGALALLAVCVLILSLPNSYAPPPEEPEVPWAEQAPQWLEADYGEAFSPGSSERLFSPVSDPELCFWAVRNSKRSAGWPGYLTNYPYVRIWQAMEAFAGARELPLELGRYSWKQGDAPMAYLIGLPLLGAEEDISALGEEIARLAGLPWHQRSAAERPTQQGIGEVGYHVYLCHKGLAFYDAYCPKNFDAEEALSRYAQAGPAFCRYILEHSGLAEKHLGDFVLLDQGLAALGENTFFLVSGADKETGEVRAQYLLASGGGMLFCLPGDGLETVSSVEDLYRGVSSHVELEDVGLVLVWDQLERWEG